MPWKPSSRTSRASLLIRLVTVFVIGLTLAPAVRAASTATEAIISIQRVNGHPDVLDLVTTSLAVPAQSQWETDPDAGPLSLTVTAGELEVRLGGGLARIERQSTLLMGERIGPLSPGRTVTLWRGDRLVVVRGFQLTVTNDNDAPASVIVVRLRQLSGPVTSTDH